MLCSHHLNVLQACAFVLSYRPSLRLLLLALPSLSASCSLATLYVMAIAISSLQDDLEYTVHSFVLIYEPQHSCLGGQIL